MAKPLSLGTVQKQFLAALEGGVSLVHAVKPWCARDYDSIASNPLHSRQARRVVALAFLWIVSAWEGFVGDAFLRYIAGAKSPAGWAPELALGPAPSLRHAYALISGRPGFDPAKQYLNWTSDEVLRRCRLYLRPGNRIALTITENRQLLDDASVIRNRIAHASGKSREAFKIVARRLRGKQLYQSYSVGDLLLEPRPDHFPAHSDGADIFDAYIGLYLNLAEQVVP